MEYDRFEQSKKRYLIAMLCLLASLGCIFFSLYILPYLIWQLQYQVPDFVIIWQERLLSDYQYTGAIAVLILFGLFFVPGLILGLIAYLLTNSIENTFYNPKPDVPEAPDRRNEKIAEETGMFFKLILIGVLILVVFAVVQGLISTPPPPQ